MKENTRQKLIDVTYEEIYSNGYQGSSLSEILKKAEVHKGSMYHYFKNKKDMALISIEEKLKARFFDKYAGIIEMDSNFIDTLFDSLKDTSTRDFKRGCPVANIVQEMSNIDEDFNKTMKDIYGNLREYFIKILDKAIQNKEIKECDSSKIALFISSTLEGAILAAKASGDEKDYLETIEVLEDYIYTLKI